MGLVMDWMIIRFGLWSLAIILPLIILFGIAAGVAVNESLIAAFGCPSEVVKCGIGIAGGPAP